MSSPEDWRSALEGFRRALAENRLAHAYVIAGPSRADNLVFAETVLQHVLCTGGPPHPCGTCPGCRQCRDHSHPDTVWIEPESKSRRITIERIRETLLPRIHQTPFVEGGWRTVVLLDAECINDAAANALLKTLEEPPPKTLLLLVTSSPRQLLPTVMSRCHRLLGTGGALEDSPWRERTLELLSLPIPAGAVERSGRVRAFRDLLEAARKAAAAEVEALEPETIEGSNVAEVDDDVWAARVNARVLIVRREILETLMLWQRDLWLLTKVIPSAPLRFPEQAEALRGQASRYTAVTAAESLRQVEALNRRLDRNLPVEQVLDAFFQSLPGA